MMKVFGGLLLCAAVAMAQPTAPATVPPCKTIAEIAAGNKDFSTLLAAVKEAGLDGALADPDAKLTVFAPVNAAFKRVKGLDALLKDKEELIHVLEYHVVTEQVLNAAALGGLTEVKTLAGDMLPIAKAGPTIKAGEALVVKADVAACNGVIHVINGVLVPDHGDGDDHDHGHEGHDH